MNDVQHGLLMSAIGEVVVRMGLDLETNEDFDTGDIVFRTSDGAIQIRVSYEKMKAMGLNPKKLRLVARE